MTGVEILALAGLVAVVIAARPGIGMAPQIHDKIVTAMIAAIATYRANTGKEIAFPAIEYADLRAGRYAAASDKHYRIRFDKRRTYSELDHILQISIPHELAHLATPGKDYHGPEWQAAFLAFGGPLSHLDEKYTDVRE